jgi:hypothetical protein
MEIMPLRFQVCQAKQSDIYIYSILLQYKLPHSHYYAYVLALQESKSPGPNHSYWLLDCGFKLGHWGHLLLVD